MYYSGLYIMSERSGQLNAIKKTSKILYATSKLADVHEFIL